MTRRKGRFDVLMIKCVNIEEMDLVLESNCIHVKGSNILLFIFNRSM